MSSPLPLPNRRRFNLDRYSLPDRLTGFEGTNTSVTHETGSRRNQMPHDHIFFEAAEEVDFAQGRCFGEHARGVLERRSRDEAISLQRRLGDSEENRDRLGRFTALLNDTTVFLFKFEPIDLVASD